MENLFGEGSDGFNVSENIFFSLFPLLEIRIIPSRVVGWILGTQDCGVLVRMGYGLVRPTRLFGREKRKREEGGSGSVMSKAETEERNGSVKQGSRHC